MTYKEFKEHFLSGAMLVYRTSFTMVKRHRLITIRKDFVAKLFNEINYVYYQYDFISKRKCFLAVQDYYKPCGYIGLFVDRATINNINNL